MTVLQIPLLARVKKLSNPHPTGLIQNSNILIDIYFWGGTSLQTPTYSHGTIPMDRSSISVPFFYHSHNLAQYWPTRSTINLLAPEIFFIRLNCGNYDNTIYVQICTKKERLHVLLSLLERDAPKSAIIFVAEQVPMHMKFF